MKNYKDPLHIPSSEYTVSHKGKEVIVLNKSLLDKQNCWANLEGIKKLHELKLEIYDLMETTNKTNELAAYDKVLTQLEFRLQDLWGFDRNANFHRFWERPKCECPQIDNSERYGTSYSIVNMKCPLHGTSLEKNDRSMEA
jgi:hypothetical protein